MDLIFKRLVDIDENCREMCVLSPGSTKGAAAALLASPAPLPPHIPALSSAFLSATLAK